MSTEKLEVKNMEEKLKVNLDKDEKLVWCGKPTTYQTMDAVYKPAFIKSCIIGIVAFAVLSVLYLWCLSKFETGMKAWLFVIFAMLTGFKPLSYFTDASKLRKATYAVTDKRLLIVGEDARAMPLEQLKTAAVKTDEAGMNTLLCGENSFKLKSSKWREAALFARTDMEHEKDNRFAFYAVEDVEGLKSALSNIGKI